ncbi:MAG: 50S ribosomal protein L4 [Aigarchaeota archaeon]|nr:50S ribosomal protein L4 [Aigarchaeota archaeon]MDW8093135.1 50S ribosomal protein L4 [Nitrososphaerota archaeon]
MTLIGRTVLADETSAPLIDIDGSRVGEVRLPRIFSAPLRPSLVRRAYIALLSHGFQPKGAWRGSAHKYSVESLGVGHGLARIARVRGRGTGRSGAGGFVPSAVGGRPTHPPVPEKRIHKRINKRELRAATIAAIAFTREREWVTKRGHRLPANIELPLIVKNSLQALKKSKEVIEFLEKIGLSEELERCRVVKMRAGRGKMRGRRYKARVGPLIVIGDDEGVVRAAGSVPGVDVVKAKDLSVLHLSPGGVPGRLCVFTESAIDRLKERFGEST